VNELATVIVLRRVTLRAPWLVVMKVGASKTIDFNGGVKRKPWIYASIR
jgi:hypothetical protein